MNSTAKEHIFIRILRKSSPEIIFKGGLVFALLLGITQTTFLFLVQIESARTVINDILTAVSSCAAALGIAYGAWWSFRHSGRQGIAWRWFLFGMTSWALGDILWAFYELILRESPFPSVADVFYLLTYPLFFLGIVKTFQKPHELIKTAWLWLDIFIVMFAGFGVYWNFLIGPSFLTNSQPLLETLIGIAYPLGDLLLIWTITLAIFLPHEPIWRNPIYLMLVGQGVTAIADSIFTYQTINGIYVSGSFYNVLFLISPLILMLSGLSQAVQSHRVLTNRNATLLENKIISPIISRLIAPFVWLLIASFLLYFNNISKQTFSPIQFSLWIVGIVVLLAIRQVLVTLDNNHMARKLKEMNDNLENRVAERTTALIQMNSELRQEMEKRNRIELTLREREEKFAHNALHDPLTDLPNRSLLIDRLSQAIQHCHRHKSHRFALLFLDFDNFQIINDSLGHDLGDQLLIQIGRHLTSMVRAEDTVARLGGDEFVILLEGYRDENFATVTVDRILDSFKQPFMLEVNPVYITASIGLVISGPGYQTAIEVFQDADIAMYEAKMNGKGTYILFSPAMRITAIDRLSLDSDIHRALEQSEFVLQYQPIYSLESERLVGFEALVRWKHPVRGLISPSEFIPIAESNGLINEITHWTIQQTCFQLSTWKSQLSYETPLFVSINLSPYSLRDPELTGWVNECLHAFSIPSHCLNVEIVETALIQNADIAKKVFTNLRILGVKVSLDDFGIGYSSLGYINQYPIDFLKIDHAFISQVTNAREVGAIVRAIIALARELDIKVVAEGIETKAQLGFVKDAGCQYGQGFYLSKPLDSQAAQNLIIQQAGF